VTHPPAVLDAGLITRTHAEFARRHGTQFLCTVPLRVEGITVAALTLERNSDPYAEDELRLLWLAADIAAPRLADLKACDRWWGARAGTAFKSAAAGLVGPRHTGAKLAALAITAVIAALLLIQVPHRLEATFTLQPGESAYLAAPFDGFLAEVWHEPGDRLAAGERIVSLDTRELRLQEAAAAADLERYRREADKARAGGQLPEMRVAQAQADQAKAQLDLVRQRIAAAVLTAPFEGVLTEGDLRRRLGAPVKHGDALVQFARLDRLYVECVVPEREMPFLRAASAGEIAFASLPRTKFPVRVTRIEPAAQVREAGNIFLVRAEPAGAAETWWRPGMSGIAKLDAGDRSLLWILTHRTIEFLRLHLWW
jgi:multidrug efflux pump subunit AcrA (membrane-fusion protein)